MLSQRYGVEKPKTMQKVNKKGSVVLHSFSALLWCFFFCRLQHFDCYKTVLTGGGATPFSNPTSKDSVSKNLGRTITIEMTNYHWISGNISPSGPPARV